MISDIIDTINKDNSTSNLSFLRNNNELLKIDKKEIEELSHINIEIIEEEFKIKTIIVKNAVLKIISLYLLIVL